LAIVEQDSDHGFVSLNYAAALSEVRAHGRATASRPEQLTPSALALAAETLTRPGEGLCALKGGLAGR
jgi:hypothetical protein